MIKFFTLLLLIISPNVLATDLSQCIHLLNRVSFGIDSTTIDRCLKQKNYKYSVLDLTTRPRVLDYKKTPEFAKKILRPSIKIKDLNLADRRAFKKERRARQVALKAWWFKEMLTTEDPFLAKMLLFWHNHFTSSLRKVKQPALIYQQHQLLRKHALGNFAELLHAIIEDPAMLIYLDNRANKKSQPNENLARELLELFTLGEGNYNEEDIKEMARALTGYSLNKNLQFHYKKRIHNNSQKHFFGQEGQL